MRSRQWRTGQTIAPATASAFVAAILSLGGCEEPAMQAVRNDAPPQGPVPVQADGPAVVDAQPAGATQPQTARADTQPANAFLTINNRVIEFPPARLRLTKTDEGVTALLYSDDPPGATRPGYAGNGFYFEFPLRAADAEQIAGEEYWYKADDSAPSESPNGVFLEGMRYHLQPQDLAIKFDGEGRRLMAQVAGRFLVVRTREEGPPGQLTPVQGTLYTTAEVREEKQ